MQAFGYLSGGRDGGPTLAEQNSRFLALCERRGYEASATFIDKDADGDRPGFGQLLDHIAGLEPEIGRAHV